MTLPTVPSHSNSNKKFEEPELTTKKELTEDLWDEIGFHKPMAGFWYNIVLNLVDILIGMVMSGVLLNYFYPFPESQGYKNATFGIFILFFRVFDLGTHMTMDRYIAEARIKDPLKMLKYIQYFIWYQMITGLLQTTSVSIFALYFVPRTEISYSVWLMLIVATTQYPGFLGVFQGIIGSLQHYDKTAVIGFVQGQIFQRITEAGIVIAFKFYGQAHPEIGELFAVAIGSAIGTYLDDFLGMILASHFFSKVMKKEGIRARDCFRINFDWNFAKEPLVFGIKTGFPGLISGFTSMYILWLYISYLPQYATYQTLVGMASSPIWIMGTATPQMTPLYSESFLNGKKELTRYYLGQAWRYSGLILGFFFSIFLVIFMFLPDAFNEFGIIYYLSAIPFMLPLLIRRTIETFSSQAGMLITGANKANYILISNLFGQGLQILFMTLFVEILQIQQLGTGGIIFIMVFGELIAGIIMTIIAYIYIQKTIIKISIPWYQTFVAPLVATILTLLLGYFAKITIYNILFNRYGFIFALIPMIVIFILLGIVVYFPLTAILGGWDNNNIRSFEKVVKMSGPSKFIVIPMFKIVKTIAEKSSIRHRFAVDASSATQEAEELLVLKKSGKLSLTH